MLQEGANERRCLILRRDLTDKLILCLAPRARRRATMKQGPARGTGKALLCWGWHASCRACSRRGQLAQVQTSATSRLILNACKSPVYSTLCGILLNLLRLPVMQSHGWSRNEQAYRLLVTVSFSSFRDKSHWYFPYQSMYPSVSRRRTGALTMSTLPERPARQTKPRVQRTHGSRF